MTSILCILAVGALLLCDDPLSGKYGMNSHFYYIQGCLNIHLLYICCKSTFKSMRENFARSEFNVLIVSHKKPILCCLLYLFNNIIYLYIEIAKKENETLVYTCFICFTLTFLCTTVTLFQWTPWIWIEFLFSFCYCIDFCHLSGIKFSHNANLFSVTGTTTFRPV